MEVQAEGAWADGEIEAIRALLAQARDQAMTHPASARYYLEAAMKRLDAFDLGFVEQDPTPAVLSPVTAPLAAAPVEPEPAPVQLGR